MEERNDILNASIKSEDELSLRPQYLNEYVGQKDLKDNLDVFIKAAQIKIGRAHV